MLVGFPGKLKSPAWNAYSTIPSNGYFLVMVEKSIFPPRPCEKAWSNV
jgi:hypothetical protein